MKRILFCCVLFLCLTIRAQILLKLSKDSLIVYSYSGGDEFKGSQLNTNYWKGPWTKINMAQNFRYNNENVRVENGLVNFLMLKRDSIYKIEPHEIDSSFIKQNKIKISDNKYLVGYSAGMIVSKEKFHYGLYELRFKVEEGKGVWPSFWFYGGYKNEEIDAFELKGEKVKDIHVDVHCPYGCDKGYKNKLGFKTNWGGWMPIRQQIDKGFNIMLIDWNPKGITWFFNGYPIAHFKGNFEHPMNLFLNTQIAANGRAFKPGPDKNTIFPNNYYVDYIRVWKKDSIPSISPQLKTSAIFEYSNQFESSYEIKPVKKRGLMYIKQAFEKQDGFISLNLTNDHNLILNTFGKISNEAVSIIIKGEKSEFVMNNFSKVNTIKLDASEKELTILIKTKNKQYQQKITLSN